ncbi:cation channel sperm-associated protein 2 [Folsomia candida]|uniref:Cation channel sperm-associated protein 2 n=1 Tax=Folsomia candida TaxID=158441 RepID=A0A226EVD2_FOLCA|nr:cation channel sperm-associated protein 2 [Folsomia candida]OXA61168.1 Cation channel sperm-associated protein 2 [Folsomia candida]
MSESDVLTSRRGYKKALEKEVPFRRSEQFHKELMEDFRFMEAARMHSGEYGAANLNTGLLQPHQRFKELMISTPQGLINFAAYAHKINNEKSDKRVVEADMRSLRFGTRMATSPPLDIFAHWLLNTYAFTVLMVLVISVNSILIAVDMEIDQGSKTEDFRSALEALDFFFLMLFVVEIGLKWVDDFRAFWKEGWNVFDFLITAVSLVAPLLDLMFDQETFKDKEEEFEGLFLTVKYLRIIRIFRSLNVVTRIHKIRLIWEAVVKTFRELFFITALMAIFFYIFAIVGIKLFDRYTLSHDPSLQYRESFKNLPNAFVTLFQLFTLDHYSQLLDEMISVLGWPSPCIYVLLWIFLGSFIFMNIFTGVMVNNFQNIRQSLLEEDSSVEQHKKLALELNVFGEDEDAVKNEDPHISWEDEVFHNLQIISALGNNLSPTIWPRDTLFQYYVLLEALASNVEEKNYILRLLDNSLLRHFDQ